MIRTWFRVALVTSLVVGLFGCPSAAPTPCIIQSPLLGGYTVQMTLQGTPPAGCESNLPPIYADFWKMDTFPENKIYVHPIAMPFPDRGGDPDPAHNPMGTGTLTDQPDSDNLCFIHTLTEMRGDVDPLGLGPGQETFIIDASSFKFLDGARYQGSQFQATANVTFGTCTGTYDLHALTPGQLFCNTDIDCSPFGNPDAGIFIGSGINPDYSVSCTKADWVTNFLSGDPNTGICFFNKPFPSLN
jgi:hypothetical protein